MKKAVITLWIVIMSYVVIDMGYDYYKYYQFKQRAPLEIKLEVKTPVATVNVEADNSVEWELIAKMLVLILVTYGGIKFINKALK